MTDLRDFAEKLYVSGTAQEAEFAKEILENLDEVERIAGYDEILETIDKAMPDNLKGGEHWRQIEYLTGRSDLLGEIEEKFARSPQTLECVGETWKAGKDAADITQCLLDTVESAAMALEAEGLEGELLDMVQSLKDICDEKVWDL